MGFRSKFHPNYEKGTIFTISIPSNLVEEEG